MFTGERDTSAEDIAARENWAFGYVDRTDSVKSGQLLEHLHPPLLPEEWTDLLQSPRLLLLPGVLSVDRTYEHGGEPIPAPPKEVGGGWFGFAGTDVRRTQNGTIVINTIDTIVDSLLVWRNDELTTGLRSPSWICCYLLQKSRSNLK